MTITNLILSPKQIEQKIHRIAIEIYERNMDEHEVVLAGIHDNGYVFARKLADALRQLSPLSVSLLAISLDKASPAQGVVSLDDDPATLQGKVVVILDDVLNTGRTLAFSMKPFLSVRVKKLQVAVLVDRNHNVFPIQADYKGYELSTTVNEHVTVVFDGELAGVYLD